MDATLPDVSFEWLFDQQLAHFVLRSTSRQAVDTWIDLLTSTLAEWPADKLCYILHDARTPKAALTPYMRSRAQELMKLRPDLHSWTAILIVPSWEAQIVQIFVSILSRGLPRVNLAIFFSEEEGMAWLKREMARNQQKVQHGR